jgi:uncharacterized protein YjdB
MKMKKMMFLMLTLLIMGAASMNAQVLIGETIGSEDTPHPGAILDLRSSNLGLKLPVVYLSDVNSFQVADEGDQTDGAGLVIFNSNEAAFGGLGTGIYVWNGSKWMFSGLNNPAANPVTSIEVIGNDDVDSGSLGAYGAAIQPADATNRDVIWTVIPETGSGSISSYGIFTGGKEGTVSIRATAADGSGVYGEKQVTVNHVDKQITFINLSSASGEPTLGSCDKLQINAAITPEDATLPNLKWSISESTPAGAASVNAATGLVTAIKGGTVTVRATALDGSSTYGEIVLEITDQTGPMDPVTGLNGTYNTYCYNGLGRWMVENSKEGTASWTTYTDKTAGERGYYYNKTNSVGACPNGWSLPTNNEALNMQKYYNSDKSNRAGYTASTYGGVVYGTNISIEWGVNSWVWTSDGRIYGFNTNGNYGDYPDNSRGHGVRCIER